MSRLLHFLSHSSLLLLARFVTEQLFEFYTVEEKRFLLIEANFDAQVKEI